ncbi:hypothetical protein V3N99_12365 [Dermatophilaceae bacterium Soc4.6]
MITPASTTTPAPASSAIDVPAPGWPTLARQVLARCWRLLAVAWRSVTRSVRLLARVHLALVLVVLVGWYQHRTSWVLAGGSVAVVLLAWPGVHRLSWTAVVERWHTIWWYYRYWEVTCGRVSLSVYRSSADQHLARRRRGLARLLPASLPWSGRATRSSKASSARMLPSSVTVVPRLQSVKVRGPVVVLRVRLVAGLTLLDVERSAPRLAVALDVPRVLVDPDGHNGARLTLTTSDMLAQPFPTTLPDQESTPSLVPQLVPGSVVVGRVEDGTDWHVPLGPSTLVAGAAGAGKGSVLWGVVLGLGPWVRTGLIRLHGIDLKGGMELLLGRGMFSTMATTPDEAVALLEDLAGQCVTRTHFLAGRVRTHTPTVTEPLHLLVIDELAAVTAYLGDRQLRDRADRALSLLLSQGRAPRFVVWAFLQDPRKDVVPQRGLFQLTIGLRLRDTSEVAMIFGDGALVGLAPCHRITRQAPGTGYVLPEGGGNPVRVRAGYTDDDTIRDAAWLYGAPGGGGRVGWSPTVATASGGSASGGTGLRGSSPAAPAAATTETAETTEIPVQSSGRDTSSDTVPLGEPVPPLPGPQPSRPRPPRKPRSPRRSTRVLPTEAGAEDVALDENVSRPAATGAGVA